MAYEELKTLAREQEQYPVTRMGVRYAIAEVVDEMDRAFMTWDYESMKEDFTETRRHFLKCAARAMRMVEEIDGKKKAVVEGGSSHEPSRAT